jgi:hypothetical protein
MSEEAPFETPGAEGSERTPAAPDDPKAAKDTAPEPKPAGDDRDGPVSESDALRSLTEGAGGYEDERAEALRAGAIADLIAQRLNADASGFRIGTLALFNDTVSFGGGFNTAGPTGARPRGGGSVVTLDATELAEHTDFFVHPDGYDDAVEALREHQLLVLTGPPGSGRVATAVNLLEEAKALSGEGDGGCHRLLDPSAVLDPSWVPPIANCGYLGVLDDGPAGLRGFTAAFGVWGTAEAGSRGGVRPLSALVAALRTAGCHLVLAGGHDLALAAAGPGGEAAGRYELTPVDPVAITERRVLGHGAAPEAQAEFYALLESAGAMEALREQPAARHAVRLASVIRAGGDLSAAVTALRDPSEQVRAWFARHRDPEAVAFALASAVLEESSYLTVADAAVKLRAALTPPEPAPPDLRFRDRLAHEQQWVRLELSGDKATAGAPIVRFRSPLIGQVILAYAWSTLDGRRSTVLDWLRQLLNHADLAVRARAAVAAGVLTWADHHYAVHRFLTTWAGSTSWPLRQAAATALGVAGSRPETAEPVWQLLHRWADGTTSAYPRRLAGTAANAVGGILGRSAPDRAVAVLLRALDRGDDWGTLPAVAWGGVHLIHHGQAGPLLDAYLDWSEPQDRSAMVAKSLSAFVFAAKQPYQPPADGIESGEGVPGVPVLLSGLPRHGERLAELWARALARKPVQDAALAALRTWIDDYADKAPGALDAIGALLLDIALRPGKHRERLLWWLGAWARDHDHPSANADALRRLMERRS